MKIIDDIKLFRINLEEHPIKNEEYLTRLYYFTILYFVIKQDNVLNIKNIELLENYKKNFNIIEKDFDNIKTLKSEDSKKDFNIMFKLLRKSYHKLVKWKIHKKNFKYLLISDILYMEDISSSKFFMDKSFVNKLIKYLKISKKDIDLIRVFLEDLNNSNFQDAKKIFKRSKFKLLKYFLKKYEDEERFYKQKDKNIIIIATMSSGKSTILNSILGQDVLPSKNEVCTSKTIKIVQNINLDRCIGLAKGDGVVLSGDLNRDILDSWNSSSKHDEITFEMKFGKRYVENKKIVFIDTPGTNNSLDDNHSKITESAFKNNNVDLILYVLNATNLACDDDYSLLCKVKEHLKNNSDKDIVFLLNKMDEIDVCEKENLNTVYKNTISYLSNIGFKDPKIISVSAYATKLFRKAMDPKSEFTRREKLKFIGLYEKFTSDEYNLNSYTNIKVKLENTNKDSLNNNSLNINNEEIQLENISYALKNTGFLQLEAFLEVN